MSSTPNLSLGLAFTILSTLAHARKHDDDYSDASADTRFEWLSPASGDSLPYGQSLTATWRSDDKIYSPSFALCNSDAGAGEDCGSESWPPVSDNGDGTYSATLTMPVIAQGLNGLHLSMKGDDGSAYTSPSFGIQGGSGAPNAYLASAAVPVSDPTALPTGYDDEMTASMTGEIEGWTMTTTAATKTKTTSRVTAFPDIALAPTNTPTEASPPYSVISAGPQAQAQAQTQAQAPLQVNLPTVSPTLLAHSTAAPTPSIALIQAENASKSPARPNATAIALPLALCGLILISALIYCARSKMFRKPGLGKDVENWQDVIKQKAAAPPPSLKPNITGNANGVEVRPRDDNPYKGYIDPDVPYLGYRGRNASKDGYSTKSSFVEDTRSTDQRDARTFNIEKERFTAVPEVNYDRRRDRDRDRDRDRERDDRYRHRCRRHPRLHSQTSSRCDRLLDDRSSHSHSSREYYSTSRRSSSGIGGVFNSFPSIRRESTCDCDRARKRDHSRSCASRHSDSSPSTPTREMYIRRPMPVQADSFGPLTNPHDAPRMDAQNRTQTRTRTITRPLPEPLIRSSTLSSRGSSMNPFDDMPRQKTLPHLSGGLRDEYPRTRSYGGSGGGQHDHVSEVGWDLDLPLAGEGAYRTGEEGMGELYDSLRRAIGR